MTEDVERLACRNEAIELGSGVDDSALGFSRARAETRAASGKLLAWR